MVICLSSPLLIGLYENDKLIKKYQSSQKTSDILDSYFKEIDQKYHIKNLFFTNTPGSFMSIKITYVFLKTLSIVKNIPLFATDGFVFNNNTPIKAVGDFYFFKKDGKILTQKIKVDSLNLCKFELPKILNKKVFSQNNHPLYILPAVKEID